MLRNRTYIPKSGPKSLRKHWEISVLRSRTREIGSISDCGTEVQLFHEIEARILNSPLFCPKQPFTQRAACPVLPYAELTHKAAWTSLNRWIVARPPNYLFLRSSEVSATVPKNGLNTVTRADLSAFRASEAERTSATISATKTSLPFTAVAPSATVAPYMTNAPNMTVTPNRIRTPPMGHAL